MFRFVLHVASGAIPFHKLRSFVSSSSRQTNGPNQIPLVMPLCIHIITRSRLKIVRPIRGRDSRFPVNMNIRDLRIPFIRSHWQERKKCRATIEMSWAKKKKTVTVANSCRCHDSSYTSPIASHSHWCYSARFHLFRMIMQNSKYKMQLLGIYSNKAYANVVPTIPMQNIHTSLTEQENTLTG